MYFNDKDNTNIDDEFENDNTLSNIFKLLTKYKIVIAIGLILVIGIIFLVYFTNNSSNNIKNVTNYLVLNGEESITIYQDSDYIELGFEAYNSKNENLTDDVVIKSTLDTSKIGEYEITYTIGDITKTRKISVIAKPKDYTYIYLKTIDNSINVYLKVGETYSEPGYQVFSSIGKDLTSQVKVTGSVDTSKKGNYKLIYSVVDSNNVTISVSRTIIVMDTEIGLSLSTEEYTNKDVTINIKVIDDYFDYLILPDNTKVADINYSYKVSSNGTYKFKVHNKKGIDKEASIEVKNIDKVSPTGSCSGSYKDGKSTISINANDNVGIYKYTIDGTSYMNNSITINKELSKVTITIYDKAGNTQNISCNLEDKNELILFDKNITLSYQYIIDDDSTIPYVLYTPSSANSEKPVPLIIWLHGSGEVGSSESAFKNSGLLKVLNEWNLEGFNAYVLCPKLKSGTWGGTQIKRNFYNLLDRIIKEKNIDNNKIILTGHSLGGMGVFQIASGNTNYYSALVIMSGYNPGIDLNEFKNIPIRGYTENSGGAYSFMQGSFSNTFGSDKLTIYSSSHGSIPSISMNEDKNNDNRSDLVEWMLTQ